MHLLTDTGVCMREAPGATATWCHTKDRGHRLLLSEPLDLVPLDRGVDVGGVFVFWWVGVGMYPVYSQLEGHGLKGPTKTIQRPIPNLEGHGFGVWAQPQSQLNSLQTLLDCQ